MNAAYRSGILEYLSGELEVSYNYAVCYCPEALELLQHSADDGLSYGDYVEQLTYLLSQGAEQDANPPFGKKSSVTIVNEAGETSKESVIINREDFWASTSIVWRRQPDPIMAFGR